MLHLEHTLLLEAYHQIHHLEVLMALQDRFLVVNHSNPHHTILLNLVHPDPDMLEDINLLPPWVQARLIQE